MNIFEKLQEAAVKQNGEGDFPDSLLSEVLEIIALQEEYSPKTELLSTLLGQIVDYDPYAGAGCFGDAVGLEAIRKTLDRIKAE